MNKNKNYKPHKTIDEQIELLIDRGLIITNKSKIRTYLSMYNYQLIINGYNDPFMRDNNRQTNKYFFNSTSQSIIDFFNFDRTISNIIFSNVQSIEKTFSSKIAYFVSEKMCSLNKKDGKILDENLFSWNIIFSPIKIEKYNIRNKIIKYVSKNDKLFSKYIVYGNNNNMELNHSDIPIWVLSLKWTFGFLIDLFKCLNQDIQYKIIKSYSHIKSDVDEFTKIMEFLIKIRNMSAHGNVLYNLSFKINKKAIKPFIIRNNLDIIVNSHGLRLYDVVKIIDKIGNKDKSKYSLKKIFDRKVREKIKNSKTIPNSSKNYILKKINWK